MEGVQLGAFSFLGLRGGSLPLRERQFCSCSSGVEHFLGKEEVTGHGFKSRHELHDQTRKKLQHYTENQKIAARASITEPKNGQGSI